MRYLLIVLVVLLAIPVIAYVGGLFISETHTATVTRQIDRPAEIVWRSLTEVQGYDRWRTGVERIEVLSDSTQPLRWREVYSNQEPITFEETARVDSTRWTVRIADDDLPFGGSWTYELERTARGTQFTITENGEVYNPLFRFISKFVMGYTDTMNRFLDDLEKHHDSET